MPSSYVDSFAPIVKMIIEMNPSKVLDIGPGNGMYGLACRNWLPDLKVLDAVEVQQGRNDYQNVIYDSIYVNDVRNLDQFKWWRHHQYDLVLMIDVIEHMSKRDGHTVLDAVMYSGAKVIVSTPKIWIDQDDDKNPFEKHLSLWCWEDFSRFGIGLDVSTIDSIIFLLRGPEA